MIVLIVDDYTRECLALVADTSLSGQRLARNWMGLSVCAAEFTRWRSCAGARRPGVEWHYVARCKPMLIKARSPITSWKEDYNRHRPHSALGNMTAEVAL